jgi:opacity protein-like surface antigen
MVRKLLVFTAFLGVLSVPTSLYGHDATGEAYIGIGFSYALEDISVDLGDFAKFKAGYHFLDWFSLQFELDHFSNFDLPIADEVEIKTYMVSARFRTRYLFSHPYAVVGYGFMHADLPAKAATGKLRKYGTEPCAKFGLGIDYFPNENVSIGVEIAYVQNFSNLEIIWYIPITLGVSCYF